MFTKKNLKKFLSELKRNVQRIIERVLIVLKLRMALSLKMWELIRIRSVSDSSELLVIVFLLDFPNVHNFIVRHAEKHSDASAYNLESLKDFVKNLAYGVDGAEDDPKGSASTVGQYWKYQMAVWRRQNDAIPKNTTSSVTNVSPAMYCSSNLDKLTKTQFYWKGPLTIETSSCPLKKKNRKRRYGYSYQKSFHCHSLRNTNYERMWWTSTLSLPLSEED